MGPDHSEDPVLGEGGGPAQPRLTLSLLPSNSTDHNPSGPGYGAGRRAAATAVLGGGRVTGHVLWLPPAPEADPRPQPLLGTCAQVRVAVGPGRGSGIRCTRARCPCLHCWLPLSSTVPRAQRGACQRTGGFGCLVLELGEAVPKVRARNPWPKSVHKGDTPSSPIRAPQCLSSSWRPHPCS